jgi:transcription termination/antitermination protein NusA
MRRRFLVTENNSDDPDGQVTAAFTREVPEVASGMVKIRAVARTPGVRTKVALDSDNPELDFIGVCSGVRGSRLANISSALGGEAVHLITWSPYPDMMVRHALAPLRVSRVEIDERTHRAVATVPQDQPAGVFATAEGQRELATRLSGWNIEIVIDPPAPNGDRPAP